MQYLSLLGCFNVVQGGRFANLAQQTGTARLQPAGAAAAGNALMQPNQFTVYPRSVSLVFGVTVHHKEADCASIMLQLSSLFSLSSLSMHSSHDHPCPYACSFLSTLADKFVGELTGSTGIWAAAAAAGQGAAAGEPFADCFGSAAM